MFFSQIESFCSFFGGGADQKCEGGEGVWAATAEEPAVSGALHVPHPLQHLPAPGEERLVAALLHPLDGTGELSDPVPTAQHCCFKGPLFYHQVWVWLTITSRFEIVVTSEFWGSVHPDVRWLYQSTRLPSGLYQLDERLVTWQFWIAD